MRRAAGAVAFVGDGKAMREGWQAQRRAQRERSRELSEAAKAHGGDLVEMHAAMLADVGAVGEQRHGNVLGAGRMAAGAAGADATSTVPGCLIGKEPGGS